MLGRKPHLLERVVCPSLSVDLPVEHVAYLHYRIACLLVDADFRIPVAAVTIRLHHRSIVALGTILGVGVGQLHLLVPADLRFVVLGQKLSGRCFRVSVETGYEFIALLFPRNQFGPQCLLEVCHRSLHIDRVVGVSYCASIPGQWWLTIVSHLVVHHLLWNARVGSYSREVFFSFLYQSRPTRLY